MFKKRTVETIVGQLVLIGTADSIEYIQFGIDRLPQRYEKQNIETSDAFPEAVIQIQEYFTGKRTKFSFPINLTVTGFQKRALVALQNVGYGQTISYKELAQMAGSAKAFRAAGTACAENPLPIVIPCHRVLKSDGSLGGFGGGLEKKKLLLDLERATYRK